MEWWVCSRSHGQPSGARRISTICRRSARSYVLFALKLHSLHSFSSTLQERTLFYTKGRGVCKGFVKISVRRAGGANRTCARRRAAKGPERIRCLPKGCTASAAAIPPNFREAPSTAAGRSGRRPRPRAAVSPKREKNGTFSLATCKRNIREANKKCRIAHERAHRRAAEVPLRHPPRAYTSARL